jgi:hypothetical protein
MVHEVKFPQFYLRNEKIWDLNLFGNDPDIDFKDFPSFSKKFYLTSSDHEGIKKYFTPDILSKLERLDKIGIAEGNLSTFVYYHASRTIGPDRYNIFVEEAATVLRLCLPG